MLDNKTKQKIKQLSALPSDMKTDFLEEFCGVHARNWIMSKSCNS